MHPCFVDLTRELQVRLIHVGSSLSGSNFTDCLMPVNAEWKTCCLLQHECETLVSGQSIMTHHASAPRSLSNVQIPEKLNTSKILSVSECNS